MLKNVVYEILCAIAWMLVGAVLLCGVANAAPGARLAAIEQAWNAHDTLAVQQGFDTSAFASQARLALLAEQGGEITVGPTGQVDARLFGAKVVRNGQEYVWLFETCADSDKWCWWGERPVSPIGSMESGQLADIATTGLGLALGFAEGNPAGLGGVGLIKGAFLIGNRVTDFQSCVDQRAGFASTGYGAAGANAVAIALAKIAGIAVPFPVSIAITGAIHYALYDPEAAMFECTDIALTRI